MKKYEEAIVCYDKALEVMPDSSDATAGKGKALKSLGQ